MFVIVIWKGRGGVGTIRRIMENEKFKLSLGEFVFFSLQHRWVFYLRIRVELLDIRCMDSLVQIVYCVLCENLVDKPTVQTQE